MPITSKMRTNFNGILLRILKLFYNSNLHSRCTDLQIFPALSRIKNVQKLGTTLFRFWTAAMLTGAIESLSYGEVMLRMQFPT